MRLYDNFFNHRICIFCTSIVFAFSSIHSSEPSIQQLAHGLSLGEIAFFYRIEKCVEKVYKHFDSKNLKKLLDDCLDLKMEVEGAIGKYIDIGDCLDRIHKEIKKTGNEISKEQFKEIRNMFKKKDKKAHAKSLYIADCLVNRMSSFIAKVGTSEQSNTQLDSAISETLLVTVTTTLCGLFLICLPEAFGVLYLGQQLFNFGLGATVLYVASEAEQKRKASQANPE